MVEAHDHRDDRFGGPASTPFDRHSRSSTVVEMPNMPAI
jgi:hypothetical protein